MGKERHNIVPAAYLFLIDGNKVLLSRRFNTGYEDGNYSMVAGHVDHDESFVQCIIREAREEAGITLKAEDLKVVHIMQRITAEAQNNERIDIFFKTDKWEGNIENREPNKCDDLSWFNLGALPENTIPYIKSALENIKNNNHYSEFGW